MKSRAHEMVIAILVLASLVSITSAVREGDRMLTLDGTPGQLTPALDDASDLMGRSDDEDMATPDDTTDLFDSSGDPPPATAPGDLPEPEQGPVAATPSPEIGAAQETSPEDGAQAQPATPRQSSGEPIRLAYIIADQQGAGALTGSVERGDERSEAARQSREYRALIAWLNERGGIAGRQIQAREFIIPLHEQADENALIRRCIQITEDYGAQFVVDTHAMTFTSSAQCFAERGVPLVTMATTLTDDLQRSLVPYVASTYPTVDRQFAAFVPRLQEAGYLEGARVAVFLDDIPEVTRPYERVLLPALRRVGAEPVAVARARQDQGGQISNAVLRFRSAGATHVIFAGHILHFLSFSNTAEAQGYRPRYAFPDYGAMNSSAAAFGLESQVRNAVAVSACNFFLCIVDRPERASNDHSTPYNRERVSPGMRRCLDTLSETRGVNYYDPQAAGASVGFPWICEHLLLWAEAAQAVGADVSSANWGTGLRQLGDGFLSARIYRPDFSDGRQSGGRFFAAGVFNADCRCYVRATNWAAVQ